MPLKLIAPEKAPGGRYYYIRGSYLGVRVYRSTGFDRKPLANAELARIQDEIERGHFDQPAPAAAPTVPTFAHAASGYLKTCPQAEVARVKRLVAHFQITPLADFDTDMIADHEPRFFTKPIESYAGATLNREYRTPLGAVLHDAAGRKLDGRPMMAWLEIEKHAEKKKTKWVEPEDAQALIAAAAEIDAGKKRHKAAHLAPLLVFLFTTGARISEACALTWANVDLARRHVILPDTKNGETYGVHLGDLAWAAIANRPKLRPAAGKVFGFRDRHAVKYSLGKACEKAGMVQLDEKGQVKRDNAGRAIGKTFNFHQARHSFATWLRRNPGTDMKKLMDLGRWKDVRSVMRYAHVASHEHAPAIAALPLELKKKGNV